jgi:hypothetical protein
MSRSERVEMLGVLAGVREKIVEAVEGSRKAIIGGQINRHPKPSVSLSEPALTTRQL